MVEKTLYKQAKSGKIQVYTSWTEGAKCFSEYGELDGKQQVAHTVCVGKNIGKSNETTPSQQAELECEAKRQLKKDKGYFDTIDEAETEEVFLPMLAKDGRKVKIKYPCDSQPKLDGVRCMARYANEEWSLMSRGGKPYDVKHVTDAMHNYVPNPVFDGELYIHGNPLQDTVSLVKKPKEGSENLEYWVYDLYFPEAPDMSWSRRKNYLNMVEVHFPIRQVVSTRVNNEEEMLALHKQYLKDGFEGSILRDLDGIYELGHRSSSLIKWKDFQDDEFLITGYKEGKGKFVGCVIWECENVEGKKFHVAPKGTLEQKKQWYRDANDIVGKDLTVRYFAYTNDGIPQFPVGITIRDYE